MNLDRGTPACGRFNRPHATEGATTRLLLLTAVLLALGVRAARGLLPATVLRISADPEGAPRYDRSTLRARPGRVTIAMTNRSRVPRDVALRGNGVRRAGAVVLEGGTSQVTATLRAGRYVFYCSLPGHEQAGLRGILSVR
jgi:plastocyanin